MQEKIDSIKRILANKLPGQDAQYKMAPSVRARPVNPWEIPEKAVTSAVLLLLYFDKNELYFPLMVRATDHTHHSSQVSLPGGRTEPEDPDEEYTALREAKEEVGIIPETVEVLGKLTPLYIPVSNFYVQPVIGITNEKPIWVPDPNEVDVLLEVPVSFLKDPGKKSKKDITLSNGLKMNVPCYEFQGYIIWGATAMILSEFSEMI